jgi:hypothetical protein
MTYHCSHRRAKTSHATRYHHGHVEEKPQRQDFIGRRHNKNRQHFIAKTNKNDLTRIKSITTGQKQKN